MDKYHQLGKGGGGGGGGVWPYWKNGYIGKHNFHEVFVAVLN